VGDISPKRDDVSDDNLAVPCAAARSGAEENASERADNKTHRSHPAE
jgi:hypothetical protein